METTSTQLEIRRELLIDARPETVWRFLADEDRQLRWIGVSARIEARPGGRVRLEVVPGRFVSGEVVEIDPPRRLVYTWGWEEGSAESETVPPGSTTVEWELVPEGAGTLLRFVHRGLPSVQAVERHTRGWDHFLPRLQTAGGGTDPGPDPWIAEQA